MTITMMKVAETTGDSAWTTNNRQKSKKKAQKTSSIDAACFFFFKEPCEICIFIGCKKEIFAVYYIIADELSECALDRKAAAEKCTDDDDDDKKE